MSDVHSDADFERRLERLTRDLEDERRQRQAFEAEVRNLPSAVETRDLVLFMQSRLTEFEKRLAEFTSQNTESAAAARDSEAELRAALEDVENHLETLKAAAPEGVARRIQDLENRIHEADARIDEDLARRRRDAEDLEARFQRQFEELWGGLERRSGGAGDAASKQDLETVFERQRELLQESFQKISGALGDERLPQQQLEERFEKYMTLMSGAWDKFLESFSAREAVHRDAVGADALAKLATRLKIHADEIEQRLALAQATNSTRIEDFARRLETAEAAYAVKAESADRRIDLARADLKAKFEDLDKRLTVLQAEFRGLRERDEAAQKTFHANYAAFMDAVSKVYSGYLKKV